MVFFLGGGGGGYLLRVWSLLQNPLNMCWGGGCGGYILRVWSLLQNPLNMCVCVCGGFVCFFWGGGGYILRVSSLQQNPLNMCLVFFFFFLHFECQVSCKIILTCVVVVVVFFGGVTFWECQVSCKILLTCLVVIVVCGGGGGGYILGVSSLLQNPPNMCSNRVLGELRLYDTLWSQSFLQNTWKFPPPPPLTKCACAFIHTWDRPTLVAWCFTCTETVGLSGMGAQDSHLDFHAAPGLWLPLPRPLSPLPRSSFVLFDVELLCVSSWWTRSPGTRRPRWCTSWCRPCRTSSQNSSTSTPSSGSSTRQR